MDQQLLLNRREVRQQAQRSERHIGMHLLGADDAFVAGAFWRPDRCYRSLSPFPLLYTFVLLILHFLDREQPALAESLLSIAL
jgi:hypothetical protein